MSPPLPAPSASGVTPVEIDAFLTLLHGPAASGPPPRKGSAPSHADLADFSSPRLLCLDVRSPSEFATGHIPGAVNLPLFSDDERAVVGTTYAKQGRYAAIRAGLGYTGVKLPEMLDVVAKHGRKPGDQVLVHCWRGGMRSGSVAWLLSLCGFKVTTLSGGYRSFRRWCKVCVGNAQAGAPTRVAVLGGCTGVGKTAVLHELRARGHQILDLEGHANHRGSAFGSVGLPPQPSNEAYENILASAVRRVDPRRPLWIEHEDMHVGKNMVPPGILSWVRNAPRGGLLLLDMTQELRVQRLVEDYCSEEKLSHEDWVNNLKDCITGQRTTRPGGGLSKRLGPVKVKQALQLLDEGRWSEVAAMMLDYYDKLYLKWASESRSASVVNVHCPTADAADNAQRVLDAFAEIAPVAPVRKDGPGRTTVAGLACILGACGLLLGAALLKPRASFLPRSSHWHLGCAAGAGLCTLRVAASMGVPGPRGIAVVQGITESSTSPPCAQAVPAEATGLPAEAAPDGVDSAQVEPVAKPDRKKPDFIGACFCGEVRVEASGEPRSVSYCHCSICRRLSGAPFSVQALFTSEQVQLHFEPGARLTSFATSRGVERSRCASCGSPVCGTLMGGRLTALPLGMLGSWRGSIAPGGETQGDAAAAAASAWLRPRHHLHYSDRVMDVCDGLPKYHASASLGGSSRGPKARLIAEVDS